MSMQRLDHRHGFYLQLFDYTLYQNLMICVIVIVIGEPSPFTQNHYFFSIIHNRTLQGCDKSFSHKLSLLSMAASIDYRELEEHVVQLSQDCRNVVKDASATSFSGGNLPCKEQSIQFRVMWLGPLYHISHMLDDVDIDYCHENCCWNCY